MRGGGVGALEGVNLSSQQQRLCVILFPPLSAEGSGVWVKKPQKQKDPLDVAENVRVVKMYYLRCTPRRCSSVPLGQWKSLIFNSARFEI